MNRSRLWVNKRSIVAVGLALSLAGSSLAFGGVWHGVLGGTGSAKAAPVWTERLWSIYYRGLHRVRPANDWEREVAQRGVLRVAVRTRALAVPPGMPHADVAEVYDVALAHYLAARLGARLEVVELSAADRAQALSDGRVDLALAGATVSPAIPERGVRREDASYFEGRGGLLVLPLAGQSAEQLTHLPTRSVCVDGSGPYRDVVERLAGAAQVRTYASALVAISAFTSNQCDALVEDAELLARLTTLDAMKYYRLTSLAIIGDSAAPVAVASTLPAVHAELDALVRTWKRTGAARQATERRAAEILLEVAQLQEGYSCH